MATLFEQIRQAVLQEKYAIGLHAANRLEERGIEEWHIIEGISELLAAAGAAG